MAARRPRNTPMSTITRTTQTPIHSTPQATAKATRPAEKDATARPASAQSSSSAEGSFAALGVPFERCKYRELTTWPDFPKRLWSTYALDEGGERRSAFNTTSFIGDGHVIENGAVLVPILSRGQRAACRQFVR